MRKKLLFLCLALVTILSLSACQSEEDKYLEQVKALKTVQVADINKMIEEKKSFNLYAGRKNCPYCIILVPQLEKLAKDDGVEIYYIDTIETTQEMDDFFKKYKLEYVPSLMVFKDGKGEEIILDHTDAKEKGNYDIDSIKEQLIK